MTYNISDNGGELNLKELANGACAALRELPGFLYCEAEENELRYYFDNDMDAECYMSLRLLQDVVRPMRVVDTVLIEYFEDNPTPPQ
jgi:hypothetical protein